MFYKTLKTVSGVLAINCNFAELCNCTLPLDFSSPKLTQLALKSTDHDMSRPAEFIKRQKCILTATIFNYKLNTAPNGVPLEKDSQCIHGRRFIDSISVLVSAICYLGSQLKLLLLLSSLHKLQFSIVLNCCGTKDFR